MELAITSLMRCHLPAVWVVLVLCSQLSSQPSSCDVLKANSLGAIRQLLQEQDNTRSAPCISAAIDRLGSAHDVKAIPVLALYLDYLDPRTGPTGASGERPRYPAVTALFQIGIPATKEVVAMIKNGKTPITRHNAALAYLFIYRDNLAAGLKGLKNEQLKSTVAQDRTRIGDALGLLSDACTGRSDAEAQECKRVIESGGGIDK